MNAKAQASKHPPVKVLTEAELHKEEKGIRWFAVAGYSCGCVEVEFVKLEVVRRTPKGAWVRKVVSESEWWDAFTGEDGVGNIDQFNEVWRPHGSRRASKTRAEALEHLWHRKTSYLRHLSQRLYATTKIEEGVRQLCAKDYSNLQTFDASTIADNPIIARSAYVKVP